MPMTGAELARAQAAYRGALEASRAWRAFSEETRHHDVTYWVLLTSLFVDPGMNRTALVDQIMHHAGVSRSTAERSIKEAKAAGYITDQPVGREVHYRLSDRLHDHCVSYFRSHMDMERLLQNLGYTARS